MLQPGPVPVAPVKDAARTPGTVAPVITQAPPPPLPLPPPPPPPRPPPGPATQPPPPRPPPPAPTPKVSAFDLGASENPNDWQKAREMLEPKVYAKHGSAAEIRLLKALCKKQGDMTCVDVCKGLEGN